MIMALVARGDPHGVGPLLAAPAVLAGELSIGWSNDYFDAGRDTAAGRDDKPLVSGILSERTVLAAALAALAVSVGLGFAVSWPTGFVNVLMMAAGWSYNAGLKATAASGLTYAIGFGLIPAFAASTFPGQPSARPWTIAAAALLGLGGHFANVVHDLAADQATGVRGLPQRVAERFGPLAVRLTALTLLLGTTALIAFADTATWPRTLGFSAAAVLALGSSRAPFLAAIAIAGINVVLFVFAGVGLT